MEFIKAFTNIIERRRRMQKLELVAINEIEKAFREEKLSVNDLLGLYSDHYQNVAEAIISQQELIRDQCPTFGRMLGWDSLNSVEDLPPGVFKLFYAGLDKSLRPDVKKAVINGNFQVIK